MRTRGGGVVDVRAESAEVRAAAPVPIMRTSHGWERRIVVFDEELLEDMVLILIGCSLDEVAAKMVGGDEYWLDLAE